MPVALRDTLYFNFFPCNVIKQGLNSLSSFASKHMLHIPSGRAEETVYKIVL